MNTTTLKVYRRVTEYFYSTTRLSYRLQSHQFVSTFSSEVKLDKSVFIGSVKIKWINKIQNMWRRVTISSGRKKPKSGKLHNDRVLRTQRQQPTTQTQTQSLWGTETPGNTNHTNNGNKIQKDRTQVPQNLDPTPETQRQKFKSLVLIPLNEI